MFDKEVESGGSTQGEEEAPITSAKSSKTSKRKKRKEGGESGKRKCVEPAGKYSILPIDCNRIRH